MKKLLFSAAIFAISSAVFAQPQVKKVADVAKFDNETIDFGKVKQNIDHLPAHRAIGTFTLTNISGAPLIIEQANPTCGCTISDYTKEPIAPGKKGVINASYSAEPLGRFEKHLTVKFAGIDEIKNITFTGEVLSADDFAKLKTATTTAAPAAATTATPAQVKKS